MRRRSAVGVVTLTAVLALSGAVAQAQVQDNTKESGEVQSSGWTGWSRLDELSREARKRPGERTGAGEGPKADGALEKKSRSSGGQKTYQEEKTQDVHGFRGYWKDHLYLETNDKNIILGIGARFNLDAASINGNNNLNESIGKQMDGTELRRFRLHLYGTFYDDIFFKLQPDFSVQSTPSRRPPPCRPASPPRRTRG